jgi:hypothetical protein
MWIPNSNCSIFQSKNKFEAQDFDLMFPNWEGYYYSPPWATETKQLTHKARFCLSYPQNFEVVFLSDPPHQKIIATKKKLDKGAKKFQLKFINPILAIFMIKISQFLVTYSAMQILSLEQCAFLLTCKLPPLDMFWPWT